MNIFVLSESPGEAAEYHCDKHVVKMVLETAQLLSGAERIRLNDFSKESPLYKLTHVNHPCSVWVRKSDANFNWLLTLFISLLAEYSRRYKKRHACSFLLEHINYRTNVGYVTPFALAMPAQYQIVGNPVESYRRYYIGEKQAIAKWNHSPKPYWWPDEYCS